jgi:hypothetical protein
MKNLKRGSDIKHESILPFKMSDQSKLEKYSIHQRTLIKKNV